MLGLSLLLAVVHLHNSYPAAGTVLAAHAVAVAACAPVSGRLADALAPRAVLLGYITAHALAYAALLAALGQHASTPVIALAAMAIGASTPPATPVTRGQWPALVCGDRLRTAYALDSALNSATFIAGPLLVAGLVLRFSPYAAAAAGGAAKVAGDLLLATAPALVGTPNRTRSPGTRRLLGPLTDSTVRLLLGIVALDTYVYGCMQIAAAASTNGHSTTGLLTGALAIGELAGALAYGARRWSASRRGQLTALHLLTAIVLTMTGAVTALLVIGLFYLAAGLASGARDALNQTVLGDATATAYRTEAFAWLTTFMWIGYGIGTTTAGQLKAHLGTGGIYLVAAAAGLTAALAASFLRQDPDPTSHPSRPSAA
jgi:MFS family permease